ncbi:MAG: type II toxin-antitoxin system ParD family antitoxin [Pseudomonadota bacterium]
MATMNVSLPDEMKIWVENQAASGRYANASDYIRDIIRRDQEKAAKIAHWRHLVAEAENEPPLDQTPDEVFDGLNARLGLTGE